MSQLNRKVVTGFVILLSILSFSANAARHRVCDGDPVIWRGDKMNMYLSTIIMPIGSDWDLHTQYMMSEWNNTPGSNFKFYIGRDTDGTVISGNGKNEIYFKNRTDDDPLAVTIHRYDCNQLFAHIEADIEINSSLDWTIANYTGSDDIERYNFDLVMLHELGHALGLIHSDSVIATMNTYYPNGGSIGHYNKVKPHGDDRFGLNILYPDASVGSDISVSRFKAGTNLGTTSLNRLLDTSGSPVDWGTRAGSYDIEYTIENLGTQSITADLKFYISSNSYISKSDTYLSRSAWNMPAGTFVSAQKRITIPSTLSSGTYYIGYLVDSSNPIQEMDENNNSISLLGRITIN